jgi:uncharacterized protein
VTPAAARRRRAEPRAGAITEHVAELRRRPGTRKPVQRTVVAHDLALSTAAVPEGADIDLDLVVESIPEGVVVDGTVEAPWRSECRRCLGVVEGTLAVDLREIFEPHPTEGETWPLHGDDLDLGPMVRDAVLLALPLAPLCDEACRGPAPEEFPAVPGASADERGGADDGPADPRWAALAGLDLTADDDTA